MSGIIYCSGNSRIPNSFEIINKTRVVSHMARSDTPTTIELCRAWPAVTSPTVVTPWVQSPSLHAQPVVPYYVSWADPHRFVNPSSRQPAACIFKKVAIALKTLDFLKRFSPHLHFFFLTFNDTNYLQKKKIFPEDEWQ